MVVKEEKKHHHSGISDFLIESYIVHIPNLENGEVSARTREADKQFV